MESKGIEQQAIDRIVPRQRTPEKCIPLGNPACLFFALKKQFDVPWGYGSDSSVFVTLPSYIFISVMTLCHETKEQDRLLGDRLIIQPVDCHRMLHYNFVED
jgi:hypothetical protein